MDLFEENNNDLGAIINYSSYFKEKKPCFSFESNYDNKHINNLAPDSNIPDSLIETINKGITLEQLNEVSHLPVCHYKTQITIHGICPTLKSNKVYGYSALVINNNKSLGVRWLAIDRKKKNRIADYVGEYGWRTFEDSQVYCYSKEFEYDKDEKQEVYNKLVNKLNKIDRSLFYGYIDILDYDYSRSSWVISNSKSNFEVVIYLQGIYEQNIQAFLESVCDDSWANIEAKYEEFKQRMEQRRAEAEQEKKEREKRRQEADAAYKQWCADNPFPEKFVKMDFSELQAGDIIGYYRQMSEGGIKIYLELFLNWKRLCYRSYNYEKGEYTIKSGHVLERKDLPEEFWVWRREAATPSATATASARPSHGDAVEIVDYGDNEVAVLGYTKHKYLELKNLGGGRWNKYIRIDGRPMAQGWCFPRHKRAELEKMFGIEANSQPAEPQPAKEEPQPQPATDEPKFKNGERVWYYGDGADGRANGWQVSILFYRNGKYMVHWESLRGGKAQFYADESELSREPRNQDEPDRTNRLKAAKAKAHELYLYAQHNIPAPKESGIDGLDDDLIEMKKRVANWLSEETLSQARGKSKDEIYKIFDNTPLPIAYIPKRFADLIDSELTDLYVYSGKAYFVDHAVNHHGNISSDKYLLIQDILNEPDEIRKTLIDGRDSYVFTKRFTRYNAVVITIEVTENGKMILHKSFFDQKKRPYANKGIRLYSLPSGGGDLPHLQGCSPIIRAKSTRQQPSCS
ncbi:MAG: hypothetical protein J5651_00490 [Salinivirgaceae bacterium]|nr:hypothetical protein [Salinivirgaceae bacterium]